MSPKAFRPPPAVTSALVRIDVSLQPRVAADDVATFFHLVRAGFSAPRKQLRNSLSRGLGLPPATVEGLLRASSIEHTRRPETLALEEWVALYRTYVHDAAHAS